MRVMGFFEPALLYAPDFLDVAIFKFADEALVRMFLCAFL